MASPVITQSMQTFMSMYCPRFYMWLCEALVFPKEEFSHHTTLGTYTDIKLVEPKCSKESYMTCYFQWTVLLNPRFSFLLVELYNY